MSTVWKFSDYISNKITWFTTSKKIAYFEFGLNVKNFHWHVFPTLISMPDTHGPFTLRDTREPIAPDAEIALKTNSICYSDNLWNLSNKNNT
jgi:hypothetical protein